MKQVNDSIETFIYNPIKNTNPVLYDIIKHALMVEKTSFSYYSNCR